MHALSTVNPPHHDNADNALSGLSGLLARHGGLPRQSLRQAADASGLTLAHLLAAVAWARDWLGAPPGPVVAPHRDPSAPPLTDSPTLRG